MQRQAGNPDLSCRPSFFRGVRGGKDGEGLGSNWPRWKVLQERLRMLADSPCPTGPLSSLFGGLVVPASPGTWPPASSSVPGCQCWALNPAPGATSCLWGTCCLCPSAALLLQMLPRAPLLKTELLGWEGRMSFGIHL